MSDSPIELLRVGFDENNWGENGDSESPEVACQSSPGASSEGLQKWLMMMMMMMMMKNTPRKINMEPDNTPLEKEKLSSKPFFSGSMLILGGVMMHMFPWCIDSHVVFSQNPLKNVPGWTEISY